MKRLLLVCLAVACSAKGQGPAGPAGDPPASPRPPEPTAAATPSNVVTEQLKDT